MRATRWIVLGLLLGLLPGCAAVKKAVNDATKVTYTYVYELDPEQVTVPAFCSPAPSVEDLASRLGQWQAIQGHIESVEVDKAEYRITRNATTGAFQIGLWVADQDSIDAATLVADTPDIEAETTYPDYRRFNWVGDGLATLNGYLADYLDSSGAPYWVCGRFTSVTAPPDFTIGLRVTLKVVVVPLS